MKDMAPQQKVLFLAITFLVASIPAGVIFWLIWPLLQIHQDPAEWFTVESVKVYNAREGEAPAMTVRRTIKQPFDGRWTAEVAQITEAGAVMICAATGTSNYEVGDTLPANLPLDWWLSPVKCNLPVGGPYVVITRWTKPPQGNPAWEVRAESNQFWIEPR